ncbi:Fatty acid hydroxylase superfamily protein [Marininema mesophilum]|uniref:Fatty acid hydroxylase superfamily protein n=1 Tax=Marininema mesophilum TaxID=1048340 RepID=A0A1H3C2F4_9BACL|nr:sterol desaturase family protein [Marininema mesophilum]SDX48108.1 Fatty acid hydroxylase superfamily protein [Marininema mesophilum]
MKRQYYKEFFTFPDIVVMNTIMFVGLVVIIPSLSRGFVWVAIVAGMIGYAMSEYLIHRFLFHLKPPSNPNFLRLLKRLHYDHHVDPDDLKLLFLPIWYSIPLITLTSAIFYGVTRDGILTVAFSVGVVGYLLYYEWKHYIAHRPLKPWTPWGRYMKKMHLWHHFKNEKYWYGVTHPLLDKAMGTYPSEKETKRSTTVRNLEGDEKQKVVGR